MAKRLRNAPVPLHRIASAIRVLRGQRVMLDADLAEIYGVETRALNQAVKRNLERFPADFMFRLKREEAELSRSQSVILDVKQGHNVKHLPFAFTEHGAIQAANVLRSPRAVAMGIYVVRAFMQLREVLASNKKLARKLARLERSVAALDVNTQQQFKEVHDAIRAFVREPSAARRPIGFTADV